MVLNPVYNEKTKHFNVDNHLIQEKVQKGVVHVCKIDSDENVADIFTKALISNQHNFLCNKLGLIYPFQIT